MRRRLKRNRFGVPSNQTISFINMINKTPDDMIKEFDAMINGPAAANIIATNNLTSTKKMKIVKKHTLNLSPAVAEAIASIESSEANSNSSQSENSSSSSSFSSSTSSSTSGGASRKRAMRKLKKMKKIRHNWSNGWGATGGELPVSAGGAGLFAALAGAISAGTSLGSLNTAFALLLGEGGSSEGITPQQDIMMETANDPGT
eukprot:UN00466